MEIGNNKNIFSTNSENFVINCKQDFSKKFEGFESLTSKTGEKFESSTGLKTTKNSLQQDQEDKWLSSEANQSNLQTENPLLDQQHNPVEEQLQKQRYNNNYSKSSKLTNKKYHKQNIASINSNTDILEYIKKSKNQNFSYKKTNIFYANSIMLPTKKHKTESKQKFSDFIQKIPLYEIQPFQTT